MPSLSDAYMHASDFAPATPRQDRSILSSQLLTPSSKIHRGARQVDASTYHRDESPCKDRASNIRKTILSAKRSSHKVASGKFRWEKKHRQVLHLLRSNLKYDWAATLAVFNIRFHKDLAASGLNSGMDKNLMSAQYSTSERLKPYWSDIDKPETSFSDNERMNLNILADELERIYLQTTNEPPVQALPERYAARKRTLEDSFTDDDFTAVATTAKVPTTPRSLKRRSAMRTPPSSSSSDESTLSTGLKQPLTTALAAVSASTRMTISPHVIPSYEYVPVAPKQAHPPLPALLYRFYDENSQGVNDEQGFIASAFQYTQGGYPPAPSCNDSRIYADSENHLNRNSVASPFISVSMGLFWVMRQAIKRAASGSKHCRIAIIDASIAGMNNKAFFIPPFHKQLKLKKVFTNGAWLYSGSHEFVIWAHIPAEAVICTISLDELPGVLQQLPDLAGAMQLNLIGTGGKSAGRTKLKAMNQVLTPPMATQLASLLLTFGMSGCTPGAAIAKVVSDFIQGFEVDVEVDSPARWKRLAGAFAMTLTANGASEEELRILEEAFLSGLRSGLGKFNWQADPAAARSMQRKALAAGLGVDVDLVALSDINAGPHRSDRTANAAALDQRSELRAHVATSSDTTGRSRTHKVNASGRNPLGFSFVEEDSEEESGIWEIHGCKDVEEDTGAGLEEEQFFESDHSSDEDFELEDELF